MKSKLYRFKIDETGDVLLNDELVRGVKEYKLSCSAKENGRAELILVMEVTVTPDDYR